MSSGPEQHHAEEVWGNRVRVPEPSQAGPRAAAHPAPAKPPLQGQARHVVATLGDGLAGTGLAGKGGSSLSIRKRPGRRPDTGEP